MEVLMSVMCICMTIRISN